MEVLLIMLLSLQYVTFSPYYSPLGPRHDDMSGGAAPINKEFPQGLLFTIVLCWYI